MQGALNSAALSALTGSALESSVTSEASASISAAGSPLDSPVILIGGVPSVTAAASSAGRRALNFSSAEAQAAAVSRAAALPAVSPLGLYLSPSVEQRHIESVSGSRFTAAAAESSLPVIDGRSRDDSVPPASSTEPGAPAARKGYNFRQRRSGRPDGATNDSASAQSGMPTAAASKAYKPSALSRLADGGGSGSGGVSSVGDGGGSRAAASVVGGASAREDSGDGPGVRLRLRIVDLVTHSPDFSPEEVVLNPESFPGWAVGDYIVIRPAGAGGVGSVRPERDSDGFVGGGGGAATTAGSAPPSSSTPLPASLPSSTIAPPYGLDAASAEGASVGSARPRQRGRCLLLRIRALAAVKGSLQLSVAASIAELVGLRAKQSVSVALLRDRAEAAALYGLTHAEVSFRDQYASRSGVWRFRKALNGACLHTGQAVAAQGMRVQVKELAAEGAVGGGGGGGNAPEPVVSGIVTPATKLTVRSRSSHIVLLLQMSHEMWQFDNDGEMLFEKVRACVQSHWRFETWLSGGS